MGIADTTWSARDVCQLVESRGGGGGLWRLEGSVVALATGRVLAGISGVEEVVIRSPLRRVASKPSKANNKRQPLAAATAKGDDPSSATASELMVDPALLSQTKKLPITPRQSNADDDDDVGSKNGSSSGGNPVTHRATLALRTSLVYTTKTRAIATEPLTQFRLRPTSPARPVSPFLPDPGSVTIKRRRDGSLHMTRGSASPSPSANEDDVRANNNGDDDDDDEDDVDNRRGVSSVVKTVNVIKGRDSTGRRWGIGGGGPSPMFNARWQFIGRRVRVSSNVSSPGVVEQCAYAAGAAGVGGVWHWSRVGRCPSWYGRGQCVTTVSAQKVRSWGDLDPAVARVLRNAGRQPLAREEQQQKQLRHGGNLLTRLAFWSNNNNNSARATPQSDATALNNASGSASASQGRSAGGGGAASATSTSRSAAGTASSGKRKKLLWVL